MMIISVISSAHYVMEAYSFVTNVFQEVIPLLVTWLGSSSAHLLRLMKLRGILKTVASEVLIHFYWVFLNLVQRLMEDAENLLLSSSSNIRVLTIKHLYGLLNCSFNIVWSIRIWRAIPILVNIIIYPFTASLRNIWSVQFGLKSLFLGDFFNKIVHIFVDKIHLLNRIWIEFLRVELLESEILAVLELHVEILLE